MADQLKPSTMANDALRELRTQSIDDGYYAILCSDPTRAIAFFMFADQLEKKIEGSEAEPPVRHGLADQCDAPPPR